MKLNFGKPDCFVVVSHVLSDAKGGDFQNEISSSEKLEHTNISFTYIVLECELIPSLAKLSPPCFVKAPHWPLFLPELKLDETSYPAQVLLSKPRRQVL